MHWDSGDLFNKAKLYMTRAFDVPRSDPLFPFWASLGLELLGRAVLANVHPTLLADPRSDAGDNLFYALGYEVKAPKSIPAHTVFTRCMRVVEDFTDFERERCMTVIDRRNEELHTAGLPFEKLPTELWLPGFFRDCSILLESIGRTLDDLIGPVEAAGARHMLVEADRDLEIEIEKRIGQSKKGFESLSVEDREARRVLGRSRLRNLQSRLHTKLVRCPACGGEASVSGEVVKFGEARLRDGLIVQERVIVATAFECPACDLALHAPSELNAAKLGGQFSIEEEYDPIEYYREQFDEAHYEPDYGND